MLLSKLPEAIYVPPTTTPQVKVSNNKKAVIEAVDNLFAKIKKEQAGSNLTQDGFRLVRNKKDAKQLIKTTNIFWSIHADSKKFIRRVIHVLRTQNEPEALQRILLLACENADPKTLQQFSSLLIELQNWKALDLLISKVNNPNSCLGKRCLQQLCEKEVPPHIFNKLVPSSHSSSFPHGQVAIIEYLCQRGEHEDAFLVADSVGKKVSIQSLKNALLDEHEQKVKVSVATVLLLANRCAVQHKRYFFFKLDAELNWTNWQAVLDKLSVKTLAALYLGLYFTNHINLKPLENYLIKHKSCCSVLKMLSETECETQHASEALQRILLLACENADSKTLKQFSSLLVELQNWKALGLLISKVNNPNSCLGKSCLQQLCEKEVPPHIFNKRVPSSHSSSFPHGQVAIIEYLCQSGEYEDAFLVADSVGKKVSVQSLKNALLDEHEQKVKVSVATVLLLANRCAVQHKRYFFFKLDAELNWANWQVVLDKLSVTTLAALYFGLYFTNHINLKPLENYLIKHKSCCSVLKMLSETKCETQRLARATGDYYRQQMESEWEAQLYAFLAPESAKASVQQVWQTLIGRAPVEVKCAEDLLQLVDASCKIIVETKNEMVAKEVRALRRSYQDYMFAIELELQSYFTDLNVGTSDEILLDERKSLLLMSLGKALTAEKLLDCLLLRPKEFKNNSIARYAAYFLLDGMGCEIDKKVEEGINSQKILPHFLALFRSSRSIAPPVCEQVFSVLKQANEVSAWRVAINRVTTTSESVEDSLEKLYLEWVEKRVNSLNTVGECTAIPVGWSAKDTAHIIYALVTKQSFHQIEEALVNSGAGITGNHTEEMWSFCERKISEVAVVHRSSVGNVVEHMKSLLPLKASGVLDTLAASNLQQSETQTAKAKAIALQRHYEYWNNRRDVEKLPCRIYGANQMAGSCSVEAPKRVARYLLNPTDYKLWGTEAKLLVAAVWFKMLNQMGLGSEIKRAIRKLLIKNYYTRLVYSKQPVKKVISIFIDLIESEELLMGRLVEATLHRAVREASKFDLALLVRTVLLRDPLVALEMIDEIVASGRQEDAVLNAVFVWNDLYLRLVKQKDEAIRSNIVQWLKSVECVPQACILAWNRYTQQRDGHYLAKRKLINRLLGEAGFPLLTDSHTTVAPLPRYSNKRKRRPTSEFLPSGRQPKRPKRVKH